MEIDSSLLKRIKTTLDSSIENSLELKQFEQNQLEAGSERMIELYEAEVEEAESVIKIIDDLLDTAPFEQDHGT